MSANIDVFQHGTNPEVVRLMCESVDTRSNTARYAAEGVQPCAEEIERLVLIEMDEQEENVMSGRAKSRWKGWVCWVCWGFVRPQPKRHDASVKRHFHRGPLRFSSLLLTNVDSRTRMIHALKQNHKYVEDSAVSSVLLCKEGSVELQNLLQYPTCRQAHCNSKHGDSMLSPSFKISDDPNIMTGG